ncbi:MAG: sulfatase-like hydrolase/transferase [Acidobacteriota bacterium]
MGEPRPGAARRILDRSSLGSSRGVCHAPSHQTVLVIFTSDNGGERYSHNWPFSFQKLNLWEGGLRVPAIVRWAGVIPTGRTTEQAATTMDWTATILAVTGTKPDPSYPLDGENLLPICRGTRTVFDRSLFWRTKLQEAARVGNWKYLKASSREYLFDLSVDLGEKVDLSTKHVEVFNKLKDQFLTWNKKMLPNPQSAPTQAS